jgi:hypothetical protein
MNGLRVFLSGHWVIGGILSSLIWFAAGKQSLKNGHPNSALTWDCGAVLTILIGIGWMIKEAEWLGLVVALVVLGIEIRAMRGILRYQEAADRKNRFPGGFWDQQ